YTRGEGDGLHSW
nr:immunoglobulin heavy chain junction region [Macaca mulatta]MOY25540.1 immunoglobulin heavy chain junction region [Macaca mulatta]